MPRARAIMMRSGRVGEGAAVICAQARRGASWLGRLHVTEHSRPKIILSHDFQKSANQGAERDASAPCFADYGLHDLFVDGGAY